MRPTDGFRAAPGRVPRSAARVAVLDPAWAVFLFRYDNEEVGPHWAMPGGGLEPGETAEKAALRELREETGWMDVPLGPLLWTWEHDFTYDGRKVRQREQIFLARAPRRDPTGDLAAAHRLDLILRWAWWSPADLTTCREALWPPELPGLVEQLGRSGPPSIPIDLGLNR